MPADVYTEYPDPRRDEWATTILPELRRISFRSLRPRPDRRTLQRIRAGRRPHPKNLRRLVAIVRVCMRTRPALKRGS